jgi:hypothetical protein
MWIVPFIYMDYIDLYVGVVVAAYPLGYVVSCMTLGW